MTTLEARPNPLRPEDGRKPEHAAPYRTNRRDIEFNLFEVFDRSEILGKGPFSEFDKDIATSSLELMQTLSVDLVAPTFIDGDRNPPIYDPKTRTVTTSPLFKDAYQRYMDQEPYLLGLPAELGGINAPPSISRAAMEFPLGANPAFYFYTLGPEMAAIMHELGQEKLAKQMIEQNMGAAMVLTEPDAGSDVGKISTKAKKVRKEDGTEEWHISGVKRFITSGEHDLTDNIMYAVLARVEDEDGKTLPGTKGLGLFAIPKFHMDQETGEPGERNGVYTTGIEDKMGIKASTTCEMTFGENEDQPAVGILVGGEHDGIKHMFRVIENARMMIGMKSMATLSRAYLDAREYAENRIQFDKPIIEHPGVRNKLTILQAYAEGLRALDLYTATFQDDMQIAKAEGRDDKHARDRNDLLLPVVKGFGSERANQLLPVALDVLGGSGYTKDYPMEQYMRDAKIDTLYEGTTDIQALDFTFRKVLKKKVKGGPLWSMLGEINSFARRDSLPRKAKVIALRKIGLAEREEMRIGEEQAPFKEERGLLADAVRDYAIMYGRLAWKARHGEKDKEALASVAQNSQRFMEAFGDIMVGWLLLRQAEVAHGKLKTAEGEDREFYQGKIDAATFFARNVLPRINADGKSVKLNLQDNEKVEKEKIIYSTDQETAVAI